MYATGFVSLCVEVCESESSAKLHSSANIGQANLFSLEQEKEMPVFLFFGCFFSGSPQVSGGSFVPRRGQRSPIRFQDPGKRSPSVALVPKRNVLVQSSDRTERNELIFESE